MSRFVIDSWAWVEYLNGTQAGMKIKKVVENAHHELFTSIISLSEVVSFVHRKNMNSALAGDALLSNSTIVNISTDSAQQAGIFHAEMRRRIHDFGLGDAFVVMAAREMKARILTGDPHFKSLKEAIFV